MPPALDRNAIEAADRDPTTDRGPSLFRITGALSVLRLGVLYASDSREISALQHCTTSMASSGVICVGDASSFCLIPGTYSARLPR